MAFAGSQIVVGSFLREDSHKNVYEEKQLKYIIINGF